MSFSITGLSIPNGASFWIRWTDFDIAPGADDGLAVDDLLADSPGVLDFAPEVVDTFPVNGATDFPINCQPHGDLQRAGQRDGARGSRWSARSVASGVTTTFSGGPTTFTLDPGVTLDER